jgi:hypothetical protein
MSYSKPFMRNLAILRALSQSAVLVLSFTFLGASLMLLLSSEKAIIEILVKVDGIEIRIDTRTQN